MSEKTDIILIQQDYGYEKEDYIAQKIIDSFGCKNLHMRIFKNDDWSFYEYTAIGNPESDGMLVIFMKGSCLVKNKTRECFVAIMENEKDEYLAVSDDGERVVFKLKSTPPKKNFFKSPRFL